METFPKKKKPRYVPSESDFWSVYDVAQGQDRVMLLTYFKTAARKSEVFKLKLSDLNMNDGRIRLWTCKRRGSDLEFDWMPMGDELKSELKKWIAYRQAQTTIDEEHVFVCLDDLPCCDKYYGRPFKHRQHVMRRLCKRAGVKPFDFHAIRHMVATKLYQEGKLLSYIQSFLRHKNAKTTELYLKSIGLDVMAAENIDTVLKRPEADKPKRPAGANVIELFPQKNSLQVAS